MPETAAYSEPELLERVRRCFRHVNDVESKQREREKEDLLFQHPEHQWSDEAKAQREGSNVGGVEVPARPMVAVSLLKQPMQLVYNQFTRARLGVNLHPVSETADPKLAEMKQGLYRRIERDGGAAGARGWAFLRGLACGRGWYRVVMGYDEDAPESGPAAWDQEIRFERILHQESVYMDPAATKADYSDARWALVAVWYTEEDFKAEFPNARAVAGETSWSELAATVPDWVRTSEGGEKGYLVAEYWYKQTTRETLKGPKGRTREKEITKVYVVKVNGYEVLEEPYEWPGKLFPLIPVTGEELIPVDGERYRQGMIRPARDGQQVYNYAITSAVEDIGRASKVPYIGVEGAFAGHENKWNTANIRNYAYLEYKQFDLEGKPVPPPQPYQIDGTKLQLSLMLAEQGRGMVNAATAVHEPSLGQLPDKREAQSGRAILALQQQADAGTSQFIQNLADVTLMYEARVVLDLMPHVYDRRGRVLSILTGEDESKLVMLGRAFTRNERGMPVPAVPGDPRAERFSLADGKYGISIDIGRAFQTRLQEGSEMLGDVLAKQPQLMSLVGPEYFEFQDWPGAKELAEMLRKVREQQYPGLVNGEGTATAEMMRGQMQAMDQQLKLTTAQLQAAVQAIQTDQAKQQAQLEKARMDNESRERIAAADNETKLAIAGFSERFAAMEGVLARLEERDARRENMAHEKAMAAAAGRSVTLTRSSGQDNEQEEGREMSDGTSSEQSQTDQPAGVP